MSKALYGAPFHCLPAPVRFVLTTLSYQAKQKLASQVKVCGVGFLLSNVVAKLCRKVLLLGSGDSGKSTILKVSNRLSLHIVLVVGLN